MLVHTRSVDRAELRPLLAAVQALRAAGLPPTPRGRSGVRGTRHGLRARDVARQNYHSGAELPPAIERVLVETRWLRASFPDAPPDEPA